MKATLDCLECTLRQALRVVRCTTDDEALQRQVLDSVARSIPNLSLDDSPAIVSQIAYTETSRITGNPDPYNELKKSQNEFALGLEDEFRRRVQNSDDPLLTALHLSAAGNVIDLGIQHADEIDILSAIAKTLEECFMIDHSDAFRESLANSKDLLFLLDNAGEIVFDKILIEELQKHTKVTAVVKGAPIINDVVMEDAVQVGLTDVCDVIDNGGAFIGSPPDLVPKSFLKRMKKADIILGKGHGNYETVDVFPGNVFLLLRAKCPLIAEHMGVELGQVGLISTQIRGY